MNLTLEQIQSVTIGAVNIFNDEEGIHFRRFTDKQLETFSALSETFRARSHCTAGCQLSFYTNSDHLLLDIVAGLKYEILVDGLPAYFFAPDKPQRFPVSLPSGEKHILISLPNYSQGILKKVVLDEGSYIRPHTYQRRFLFLGDSITQGNQSSRDSFCYAYRVSRFFDAQIMNLGVGSSHMCAETLEDVGFDPDVVFIAYGTNDYFTSASSDALETSCKAYFDRVQQLYGTKKIFYISPLWRADGDLVRRAGNLNDCRSIMIRQSQEHGFIHIDGYTLVPHSPFYFNDGMLHPNDLGFSLYSENLIKFLLKHL